jgi:hypothetical protein
VDCVSKGWHEILFQVLSEKASWTGKEIFFLGSDTFLGLDRWYQTSQDEETFT